MGTKQGNWEVKELLQEDERRGTMYDGTNSEYASSLYPQTNRGASNFGL